MKNRVILLFAIILVALAGHLLAQSSGGQICVRAYEDRNGNQTQDPGEPFITRGLSASLADAEGVIIQSLLMEDSPRYAQGIVCFQGLLAGQYTVTVVSADYKPVTPNTFVTSVTENSVPVPFDFGAQQILSSATPTRQAGALSMTPAEQRALLEKIFFAAIGAMVVVGLMTVIGAILYFLFFRVSAPPSRRSTGQMYAVTGTGQYPAVNPTATGQYPAARSTGQHPAAPGTPGSPMRPVDPATGQLRYQQFMPPAPLPDPLGLDDTGPGKAVQPIQPTISEPSINPDDDTGQHRPVSDDEVPG